MRSERDHYYYQLAPFLGEFRRGLPVLVYHKFGFPGLRSPDKGLFIAPKLFTRQLAELKAAGFKPRELDAGATDGNGVAVTFDDGYASAFTHATEPLREYGFAAIQFLTAGCLGKTSSWDAQSEPLMDKAQVRDWLQAGHSIGAHTVNHVRLPQVDEARAREEITTSRKLLEDEFGVAVKRFCYPYGEWNRRVAEMVAEAGYQTASTTVSGVNPLGADPFALKRIHAYVPLGSLAGLWYYLRR